MNGSPLWSTETIVADAQTLHSADLPARRGLWAMRPTRPAFVLGSSQPSSDIDDVVCADLGIDVARRRSGGGAVYVDPVDTVWVDIVIPRSDTQWVDDVGRAMHFVGHAWRDVLVDFGVDDLVVNEGPHLGNDWSKQLCVAGRGTGEVFAEDGRKVVGISQRRTREFARFQCVAYFAWNADLHARAIVGLRGEAARVSRLVRVVPRVDADLLVKRLADTLPPG